VRSITIKKKLYFTEKQVSFSELESFFVNLKHGDVVAVTCPCRSQGKQSDRSCSHNNPVGACIFTGDSARHLLAIGVGVSVPATNVTRYLNYMTSTGLQAKCDTELSDNTVICFCCGCCCSHQKHSLFENNLNKPDSKIMFQETIPCSMCGLCMETCITGAIKTDADGDRVNIDDAACIGCGVCVYLCPERALKLNDNFDYNNKMER